MDFATQLVALKQLLGNVARKTDGWDLLVDVPRAGQSFDILNFDFLHDLQTPALEAPRKLGRSYRRLSSQFFFDRRWGGAR